MKTNIFYTPFLCLGLNAYAQKTIVSDTVKTYKTEIKTSRLDFNVNLRTSHLWRGLVINDGMTATGYIHYALDKKQNYTVGFWCGARFDRKYTEINYFVQYQKKLYLGLKLFSVSTTIYSEGNLVICP